MRLVSLALMLFFINSFMNISAASQHSGVVYIAKGNIASQAPSSFPFEEKEDSDSLGEYKEDFALFSLSGFSHDFANKKFFSFRVEISLTHVTYCIGSPLYLAHRTFLI